MREIHRSLMRVFLRLFARGPIVYCLESADLPDDVRLLDVCLPRDAQLTPGKSQTLPGITTLNTCAVSISQGDWSNRLYRDLSSSPARPIPITLIPYFAWDNRGPGEMTVWIPLR